MNRTLRLGLGILLGSVRSQANRASLSSRLSWV